MKIKLKTIEDVGDLAGKRVLVRADFNVPVEEGKIHDTYRIDKAIATIDILRHKKAKVVLLSHIESDEKTLLPILDYLNGFLPIKFSKDYFTKEADELVASLKDGEVLLFENIRINEGEKNNDSSFAEKLSKYGDIFVNDAFSVSHREHTSVIGLPQLLPTFFGPLFVEEVENLSKVFDAPHPFVFILGGAKFSTKMPLVEKYLKLADSVCIVGALANDIFKAKGFEVGKSIVSKNVPDLSSLLENQKLFYPSDVTVLKEDRTKEVKKVDDVLPADYIGDIGPESLEKIFEKAKSAKFVLWNGPTGHYEIGFTENTESLAKFLASSNSEVIVGGGDTVSSIQNLGILDKFTFVSTAGGAMLDFLANETLPGIEAGQN
jgi:phosphoglycerate kinase